MLVSSLDRLDELALRYLITDRNAAYAHAVVQEGRAMVRSLPWRNWQASDYRHDPKNPEKFERYQAETLIHQYLPVDGMQAIITHDRSSQVIVQRMVTGAGTETRVAVRPDFYP